jgi:hypothetical protein
MPHSFLKLVTVTKSQDNFYADYLLNSIFINLYEYNIRTAVPSLLLYIWHLTTASVWLIANEALILSADTNGAQ